MTRTRPKALVVLFFGIVASGAPQSAEPNFQTFKDVCLDTANQSDRISDTMTRLDGWAPVPPGDQAVLTGLENNRTWYLRNDVELGLVVSGSVPEEGKEWQGLNLCMLAMPKNSLTVEDASQFLVRSGGLHALPEDQQPGDEDVFFAHLIEGNWMMAGIHVLPSGTHLQFLLVDVPDDVARAAIERAGSEPQR